MCDEKYTDLTLLEEHELEHDLVDESALLHSNVDDAVMIQMVDVSNMILGHELIAGDNA